VRYARKVGYSAKSVQIIDRFSSIVGFYRVGCTTGCYNETGAQNCLVISDYQIFTKDQKDQKDLKDLKDQKDQRGSEGLEGLEGSEGSEFSFQLVLHSPNPLRLCYYSCIFYSVYKNCGNSTS
jgi:hypothetical protein